MNQNYKCKICGSGDIRKAFKNSDKIFRCNNCDMAFLPPEFNRDSNLSDYYSESEHYSEATNRDYQTKSFIEGAKKRLKYIKKFIKPIGKTLLDVGAHAGFFVKESNTIGFEAMGVEPNKHLAEYANKKGIAIINSYFEDFEPNKTFDVITFFHVLDHINKPVDILQKVKEVLNLGGYIIIEVPNIDSYSAKRDGIFWKFINIEHNFYYSEKSFKKLFDSLEFEIISTKKWNFELSGSRGIRGILRAYIWGHELPIDRLQPRNLFNRPKEVVEGKGIKKLIREILAYFINSIGRGDNILIIAKKL